jgi:hypothetical protein
LPIERNCATGAPNSPAGARLPTDLPISHRHYDVFELGAAPHAEIAQDRLGFKTDHPLTRPRSGDETHALQLLQPADGETELPIPSDRRGCAGAGSSPPVSRFPRDRCASVQ